MDALANFEQAFSPEYSTRRACTKWNLQVYPAAMRII
jgi:hypothetical protein